MGTSFVTLRTLRDVEIVSLRFFVDHAVAVSDHLAPELLGDGNAARYSKS